MNRMELINKINQKYQESGPTEQIILMRGILMRLNDLNLASFAEEIGLSDKYCFCGHIEKQEDGI